MLSKSSARRLPGSRPSSTRFPLSCGRASLTDPRNISTNAGTSTPACPWNRGKVGDGRWSFTPMTWISSFVNGGPCWMPPNQANWKLASGDMTESTVGSSSVLFHSSTLKAPSSGGLEAIPTSKIEKERRKNSLRRSVSFAGLPMLYRKPLSSWTRRATRSTRTRQCSTIMEDVVTSDYRASIFHPEDLERVREERKAGLARGLPFEIEQRALRKDGQYRWLFLRYNPFHDEQGRLVRWYASGTDIDDRKRAEDRTRNENVALREDIVRSSMFEEIVGSSDALRTVLTQIAKVAPTDSTVLILGETGTGKELIARAIHHRSRRANRAFIRVNCAALPLSLIASELFGHEKGAFTGALQRRYGRFESADGGTIFLDEIGELPHETQIALLRVLQEREFERVGGNEAISVDVRVLTATNKDLTAAVRNGTFREDLF